MKDTTFHNIVNNEIHPSKTTDAGLAPRSGEKLWAVPIASSEDLDVAVQSAQKAFVTWSKVPFEARQDKLRQLQKILVDNKQLLSDIIGQETGKSTFMSELEIDDCCNFLSFNASQTLPDEVVFEDDTLKIVATHEPLGVVAAICPWNFPLVLAMGKIATGLLTGNCVIVKPSPFTPYATLKFVELASAVLPAGVLQALNGDVNLGALITRHPDIQKISFTGSTATGKKIMEASAATLKRVTLELGGNDGCIVCPDVDVPSTAAQVAVGCFFHSGQMCVATKRVYVHKDIFDEFMKHFLQEVSKIKIDRPPQEWSVLGPVTNRMQYDIVKSYIDDCEKNGYKVVAGGSGELGNGLWIPPTVVENPPEDSMIVNGEQFGPIIPVLTWETEDDVIRRVNATQSGLGASLWSKDADKAQQLARRLESGTVWVNNFPKPVPMGFFNGWKQSGIGGEWGRQGLYSYVNTRSIHFYKNKL
ncbi:aldehyde dehydrogenase-like protein [Thelonectria olida]|uniref:aldehyde dehydrogenase (NAD(+)) n=1 Tax=Thelonectria olida TaxID=1576542 RepID=A0A9P8VY68_9HYPO|nr:aldehyde dehydrogenase-like protein [Thelonectria olida]